MLSGENKATCFSWEIESLTWGACRGPKRNLALEYLFFVA